MTRIVFLLQHLHLVNGDEENVKTLGVFASRDSALAAVDRFRKLPGFRDAPQLANASAPGVSEGFYLDEFELDQDSWSEGYVTA
ncbi:hypothetical protein J2W49_005172 [Hydrogenophaga palleronii]|jgi:hypothetical protein|uniref:DUF7336 domain-containing protein n=1 Tax=Hydrogenophaga palleronii TaxID=65655 RepID=A0ABU1WV59_9BURK|nr:hypothetical protein [Hydrogenophaga palleronii]MDR7153192.1 hypothetical protein [Hydrogenophaga palleronii]